MLACDSPFQFTTYALNCVPNLRDSIIVHPSTSIILSSRLVAILRLDDLSSAIDLAKALLEGGVCALEFTLTNAEAPRAIRKCLDAIEALQNGSATIGLGSVRNMKEAQLAAECGAQFVVSPITDLPIIDFCNKKSISISAGAYTPTEILAAWNAGCDIVKVFPARNLGPAFIKDVLAPMPFLRLMPTGGVDLQNVRSYFQAGAAAVGVGGQFLKNEWIENRKWDAVRNAARSFVDACHSEQNPI